MLEVLPQPPPLKSSGVLASALVAILAGIALVSPPVVVGTSAVATSGSAGVSATSTSTTGSGILREGQAIVESRWWTGEYPIDPSRFTIDGHGSISKDDVYNPDSDLAREIRQKYESKE